MKFNKIRLVFENCETLVINASDIVALKTSPAQTSYHKNYGNSIIEEHEIKHIFLAVKNGTKADPDSVSWDDDSIARFRNDVTNITFISDNESKNYVVRWEESNTNNYSSAYQRCTTTLDGHQVWINSSDVIMDLQISDVDELASFMNI